MQKLVKDELSHGEQDEREGVVLRLTLNHEFLGIFIIILVEKTNNYV